jgi:hypothetical protein
MGAFAKIKKIHEPFAVGGNIVQAAGYFTGPTAYDTGGTLIAARDFGLTYFTAAFASMSDSKTRLAFPVFPPGGDKAKSIYIYVADGSGNQAAGGSDISVHKFRFTVQGVL